MNHPIVNFYTSDFLAGTSGMTAATKGVYITVLCLIYESEAPLTQSWDTLARRCGSTLPAFKRAIEALEDDGKVEVSDGTIWCEKCAKHIALRRERQSSAKAAAKKRWGKTEEKHSERDAAAMRPQCQPEPEPEPDRDTIVSHPPTPQRGAFRVTRPRPRSQVSSQKAKPRKSESEHSIEAFRKFWEEVYPHPDGKTRKADAEKHWRKAVDSGVDPSHVLSKAAQHAEHCSITGKERYAGRAANWLSRRQ